MSFTMKASIPVISSTTFHLVDSLADLGPVLVTRVDGAVAFGKVDSIMAEALAAHHHEGIPDVVMHGSPRAVALLGYSRLVWINAHQLGDLIRAEFGDGVGPIRLVSCSTAAEPDGFAQQLADYLGRPIIGSTTPVTISSGRAYPINNGRWIWCEPAILLHQR